MKLKLFSALLAVSLLVVGVSAWDPFAAAPAAAYPTVQNCTIPVLDGEILELTAEDLELRLEIPAGSLDGITITELPREGEGALFLDGVEVEVYDYLTRADVNRLVFIPYAGAETARFSLLPNAPEQETVAAANLNIKVLAGQNSAPQLEGLQLETAKNISAAGYLNAVDPDGDPLTFRLLAGPGKGKLTFEGASFVYEPFYNVTGTDSFTVCAVDSVGNFSQQALVQVQIEKQKQTFSYSDMMQNPSHYAAVKLQEVGVYSGTQVGSKHFFFPDRVMYRGDFVMLLVQSCGVSVSPAVHSGLPNDSELPQWFKPYAKAAVECGILPENTAFTYYEIPTRTEAVVMTGRASGIDDVKQYSLWMSDAGDIPEWAAPSYISLAAYRMLDLYDGKALPNKALDNSYAADLAWQLYKHKHR